jgi:hypothetical protein
VVVPVRSPISQISDPALKALALQHGVGSLRHNILFLGNKPDLAAWESEFTPDRSGPSHPKRFDRLRELIASDPFFSPTSRILAEKVRQHFRDYNWAKEGPCICLCFVFCLLVFGLAPMIGGGVIISLSLDAGLSLLILGFVMALIACVLIASYLYQKCTVESAFEKISREVENFPDDFSNDMIVNC